MMQPEASEVVPIMFGYQAIAINSYTLGKIKNPLVM